MKCCISSDFQNIHLQSIMRQLWNSVSNNPFSTQKHSWLQLEIIINKFSTDIDLYNINIWKAMRDNIFIIF